MGYAQLQLRGDTAANWTSANPVLADREIAVETDTRQFKIGDGVAAWNALPYGGIAGDIGPEGPEGPQGVPGIQGGPGPKGDPGPWTAITQAAYDALNPPDPNTLYVVID